MVSNSSSPGGGGDSRSRHRSYESEAQQRGDRGVSEKSKREKEDRRRKRERHQDEDDRPVRSSERPRESGRWERHNALDGKRRRHNDKEEEESHEMRSSELQREGERRYKEGLKEKDQQPRKYKESDQQQDKGKKICYSSKEEEHHKTGVHSTLTPRAKERAISEGDRHCKERDQQQQNEVKVYYSSKQVRVSRWDEKPPVKTADTTTLSNENGESCIILHNVFDASVKREEDFYLRTRNYFHGKSPRFGEVHDVFVDRNSGCVYMLFDSPSSADRGATGWNNVVYDGNVISTSFYNTATYKSRHQVYRADIELKTR